MNRLRENRKPDSGIMDEFFWKRFLIIGTSLVGIGLTLFSGLFLYASTYRHRVLPGVTIGGHLPVGGLEKEALVRRIREQASVLAETGIDVTYSVEHRAGGFVLYPTTVTEDATIELIRIDADVAADMLIAYGKQGSLLSRVISPFRTRLTRPGEQISGIAADRGGLSRALKERLQTYEFVPKNAAVVIASPNPLSYEVVSSTSGVVYKYDQAIDEIVRAWAELRDAVVTLERTVEEPDIREADLARILPTLPALFAGGDLRVVTTAGAAPRRWIISTRLLADWVRPEMREDGKVLWGLHDGLAADYIERTILPLVRVEARDAKFRVDERGKVVEFQGSMEGVRVDVPATIAALEAALMARAMGRDAPEASLAISIVQPRVSTEEANALGISKILGVGTSNFLGSPPNRVKNIRHAANKLDGVLIKPGEIFSTLAAVGPFKESDGYLPELVIKGDELKPEIGGGLCQIGTTLFRMAMKSAMPIAERRNHSLVVTYYSDTRNGNPGTDATIYESWPDFKFINDTAHHVLIQTEMNEKTGDLVFSLWGTSDGRDGAFSAPKVKRWIPHGDTKLIETTKLPPGEKKCQKAFPGAEASFVYTRTLPDGTKEEKKYESYYRPLPEICLVGVAAASTTPSGISEEIVGVPTG